MRDSIPKARPQPKYPYLEASVLWDGSTRGLPGQWERTLRTSPIALGMSQVPKLNSCCSRQMKKDVKTVASWDFERIIPCHGVRSTLLLLEIFDESFSQDVIETDGKKAWKEAYKFYID